MKSPYARQRPIHMPKPAEFVSVAKSRQQARPEILAPAGSFASAIAAIEAGANAIYLGLQEFSARKGATNFTIEELSRLKTAADRGVATGGASKSDRATHNHGATAFDTPRRTSIYVAINTVMAERELASLTPILYHLKRLSIDGIIVQDLAVARLVKELAPEIPIHGSTQMAVHSVGGAKSLAELGFQRVVVARELTLSEIAEIHVAVPEIELEAFIHGAMCYSVSGNCLASGLMLSRSANRGECGQICRTWFQGASLKQVGNQRNNDSQQQPANQRGYFFSLKDREMGMHIQELAKAGVISFKIEGRMKSPAYVRAVVAMYREAIDAGNISATTREKVHTIWNRAPLKSAPHETSAQQIPVTDPAITSQYPGHRGMVAARVISEKGGQGRQQHNQQGGQVTVEALTNLSIRDGILWFSNPKDDIPTPHKEAIRSIRSTKGKPITTLHKGSQGLLSLKNPPPKGAVIYKISSHNQQGKEASANQYKPYRHRVPLEVTVEQRSNGVTVTISTEETFWIPFSTTIKVDAIETTDPRSMGSAIQDTIGRGSELFIGEIVSCTGANELRSLGITIPRSTLKKINRQWVAKFEAHWNTLQHKPLEDTIDHAKTPFHHSWEQIIPSGVLPFITEPQHIPSLATITKDQDMQTAWIPLAPACYNESAYWAELHTQIVALQAKGLQVALGINNIGHLHYVKPLLKAGKAQYFLDIYFYTANRLSLAETIDYMGTPPLFACFWVEGSRDHYGSLKPNVPVPLVWVENTSNIPLFISRSCYAKEVLGRRCAECRKLGNGQGQVTPSQTGQGQPQSYKLEQSGKKYQLFIENCVNYLMREQVRAT